MHVYLEDLRYIGSFYTWKNIRERDGNIAYKLDRILVNDVWLDKFLNSMGIFQTNFLSNHNLSVLFGGKQ